MVAMKRPASFTAREAKRAKKASADLKRMCEAVAGALLSASPAFPEPVLEMLSGNVADSLAIAKEIRHPFQQQVVAMIGEVLGTVDTAAQEKVAAAQSKVGEVTAAKDELEAAERVAADEFIAKVEATGAAATAATEASEALSAAEAALEDAQAALAETKAAQEQDAGRKQELGAMLAEKYTPLKEGTLEERSATKSLVAAVVRFAKECSLDETLLSTLPLALAKTPADRGTFDKLVLEQLSEVFTKVIADLEAKITKIGTTIGDQQAKVDEATDTLGKAKAADQDAKAAVDDAKALQKQATAKRGEAKAALKAALPLIKEAAAALGEAESELGELREGPMKAYQALVELSNVVPEEPEEPAPEEPEPAAEDPAPEAAAGEEQPAA